MTEASDLYDASFFEFHTRWEPEYYHVPHWLCAFLDFDTAIDLGCGNGYFVAGLRRAGRQAFGVEVAREVALPYIPQDVHDYVVGYDFLHTRPMLADLVICTEVAEHLDPRLGRRLCSVIAKSARKWVFFTAATPGQGGHHHVNEMPHEYWIKQMQRRGLRLDDMKTHLAKKLLAEKMPVMSWIPRNAMIFQQTQQIEWPRQITLDSL